MTLPGRIGSRSGTWETRVGLPRVLGPADRELEVAVEARDLPWEPLPECPTGPAGGIQGRWRLSRITATAWAPWAMATGMLGSSGFVTSPTAQTPAAEVAKRASTVR